jgi:hypothetical protein
MHKSNFKLGTKNACNPKQNAYHCICGWGNRPPQTLERRSKMATSTKETPAKSAPVKAAPAPKAKQLYLKVTGQPEKPYRAKSARAAWWDFIQSQNGKAVTAAVAAAQAKPPSTPTNGKLKDKCEPPMGWVNYFKAQGVLTLISK